jgi:hypothetical protein
MTRGFGYTAFVIDAFAGLIPGWECSVNKQTAFVERAIRQAAPYRARQGHPLVGGVDTHKDLYVAAVIDYGETVLATRSFSTTRAGYRALICWMRSFGDAPDRRGGHR